MKQSYGRVLGSIRRYSPFLTFAEQGKSPAEVKQSIVSLLSPYFTSQGALSELAVQLVAEAVQVAKIESDAWAKVMLQNVLNEYRGAMAVDKDACLEGCADWELKIQRGISEHWSLFYLEIPKQDLPLDEFRYEVFRDIGAIIEACLQPLLRDLLLQVRILRGKANPQTGLETLDLGKVVAELFDTLQYPELVAPPPRRIRLNQWRNMAQHHKTRVENGFVIATYGKPGNEREVKFERDELLYALIRAYSIFSIIKTARTIFLMDNISEFRLHFKGANVRRDAEVLHLATSIAMQGFEVTDISIEEKSVTVVVKDVTDSPTKERMLHASQFLYPTWLEFQVDEVTVQYLDKPGDLILTIVGRGSDCVEVANHAIPFAELANRVLFTLSDKGKSLTSKPAC